MTRISYILFSLTLICLIISLILYKYSWENSRKFNDRVRTVNTVLLLLERTEKLENTLRKTIAENSGQKDSTLNFTLEQKSEADSILNTLHTIALFDDQRLRIDTIKSLFNINFQATLGLRETASYDQTSAVISRAKTYAGKRLNEQIQYYDQHENHLILSVNIILFLSFMLFAVGVWSTIAENLDKRKLKNLHEFILSNASIGIAVYEVEKNNSDGLNLKHTFSNNGAVSLKSSNGHEAVINLSDLPLHDQELSRDIFVVVTTGKTISREMQYAVGDHTYWFIINLSKVAPKNVAFYYQEITTIKSFEAELNSKVKELEKVNKDLEQFAHATSHDLREPFRKIQVMADFLEKKYKPENQEKYLSTIIRAAHKGSQLVEQILNYSKIQFDKSELVIVDLNKVAAQVLDDFDLLIMDKDATIKCDRLPEIEANAVQMVQLFSNLLGNALKFLSPERKPEIHIKYKLISSGEGIVDLDPTQQYHVITIADNGIGFDESQNDKIFNAFSRLNNYDDFPGFGLGLSLCKKIVMNHKGSIVAHSVVDKGSEFFIYLPKSTR